MFPFPRKITETTPVQIEVTQADIEDNLRRGGGSTVDNQPGTDGPIWPAVLESARAKMLDRNHADGLDQGYNDMNGGHPRDAMFTLTGHKGNDTLLLGTTFGDKLLPGEPFNEHVYNTIRQALDSGRAVTLDTSFIDTDDGLAGSHVYIVEDISKNEQGEIVVTLRNPWASNPVGEGKPNEGSPTITVKLKDLLGSGRFFTTSTEPRIMAPGPFGPERQQPQPGGQVV
jgi:hypothetical protein